MLGKNYSYKWYNLSDITGFSNKIWLQNVNKNATIRWNSYSFANSFGSTFWPRIAESRLFTITWTIFSANKAEREQKRQLLSNIFSIESNLSWLNQRFFPLTRQTKENQDRIVNAMVFSAINPTNWLDDPFINREVELIAQDPRVYDPTEIVVTGWPWQMWAWPLANILPEPSIDTIVDWIVCTHTWDREAPTKIEVNWFCVNPKILVFQSWKLIHFFKIDGNTNNLIIDNTDTSSNNRDIRFVVTDNWVNIKAKRRKVGWWWPLFIWAYNAENINNQDSIVVLLIDNYTENKDNVNVTIKYRNTYSY